MYSIGLLGSYPLQAVPAFDIIEKTATFKKLPSSYKYPRVSKSAVFTYYVVECDHTEDFNSHHDCASGNCDTEIQSLYQLNRGFLMHSTSICFTCKLTNGLVIINVVGYNVFNSV
jgi:hypothetical protein